MYLRNDIINAFHKKKFPYKDSEFKIKEEKSKKEEKLEELINNSIALIERDLKDINNDLFQKDFDLVPGVLAKTLFEIKDAKENSRFVKETRNKWSNLKNKI